MGGRSTGGAERKLSLGLHQGNVWRVVTVVGNGNGQENTRVGSTLIFVSLFYLSPQISKAQLSILTLMEIDLFA